MRFLTCSFAHASREHHVFFKITNASSDSIVSGVPSVPVSLSMTVPDGEWCIGQSEETRSPFRCLARLILWTRRAGGGLIKQTQLILYLKGWPHLGFKRSPIKGFPEDWSGCGDKSGRGHWGAGKGAGGGRELALQETPGNIWCPALRHLPCCSTKADSNNYSIITNVCMHVPVCRHSLHQAAFPPVRRTCFTSHPAMAVVNVDG